MAKKVLPPDPDGLNHSRAEWAAAALDAFDEAVGGDREDSISDLLCDLMHYCDRTSCDFDNELQRARGHYQEETREMPDA